MQEHSPASSRAESRRDSRGPAALPKKKRKSLSYCFFFFSEDSSPVGQFAAKKPPFGVVCRVRGTQNGDASLQQALCAGARCVMLCSRYFFDT